MNSSIITRARILDVNTATHTATVEYEYDGSVRSDVSMLSPYSNAQAGAGNYGIPENGSICYVMKASDNSNPAIIGYVMPNGAGEGQSGGMPPMSPGDQATVGTNGNYIIARQSGVVDIGATPLSSISLEPEKNTIRMVFENLEMLSTLGALNWKGDESSSGMEWKIGGSSGAGSVVRIRAGSVVTGKHPAGTNNMPSGESMRFEIIVDPGGGTAASFGIHVSNDGSVSLETVKNAAILVDGSMEVRVDDTATIQVGNGATINVIGKTALSSDTVEVSASSIKLLSSAVTLGPSSASASSIAKAGPVKSVLTELATAAGLLPKVLADINKIGTTNTKAS